MEVYIRLGADTCRPLLEKNTFVTDISPCQCFSPLTGQIATHTHPHEYTRTHTPRQGRQLAKWRSDLKQVLSECYRSLSK